LWKKPGSIVIYVTSRGPAFKTGTQKQLPISRPFRWLRGSLSTSTLIAVFIDAFSRWVEAYPMKKETANVVIKKILEEIFPQFGIPKVIGSNNGPAFVAQVNQGLAIQLGIVWKLHCAYRPQSSGQEESMNRTLKETLTTLTLETSRNDWTALLPFALFSFRNTLEKFKLTLYEILYGGPPPLTDVGRVLYLLEFNSGPSLFKRMKALEVVRNSAWEQIKEAYEPRDLMVPHQFQVRDAVLVRQHRAGNLEPRWKGPYHPH
jgi:transposase InsO family protein